MSPTKRPRTHEFAHLAFGRRGPPWAEPAGQPAAVVRGYTGRGSGLSEITGQKKRRSLIGRGSGDNPATSKRDPDRAPPAPTQARPGPTSESTPAVPAGWIDAPAPKRTPTATPSPSPQRVTPAPVVRGPDVDAPPLSSLGVKTTPLPVQARPDVPPPAPAREAPVADAAADAAPITPSAVRRREGVLDSGVGGLFDEFTKRPPPAPSDMGPIARTDPPAALVLGCVSVLAIAVAVVFWYALG